MSGTFSMWTIIELVIGLWIPWVMLQFYATPIPGVGFTFPGLIAGGGNWLHSFFLGDIVPAMQIELSNLVHTQTTAVSDAWAGTSWLELYTALGDVVGTLIIGTSMMLFIFLCLVVIYAVTYAQVIWAQMAMLILTFVGPMMIPWLVFEPMTFLFWGWFRSMITFALYCAIAGAIMRVFMSVCLGYITTFSQVSDIESPVQMVSWLLAEGSAQNRANLYAKRFRVGACWIGAGIDRYEDEARRRSMAKPKTHIRKDDRNPESSVGGLRRTLCGLFIPLEQLDNANPSCQKCLQFRKKAR